MSKFAIVPDEVIRDRRLSLIQTRVLIALFRFRGKDTNVVFPKREALAELTGYTVQRISKATTELADLGWLKKHGDGGRSKGAEYEITVPDLDTVSMPEKGGNTVPGSGTVFKPQTVSEPETVPEPETVSTSDTKTVPEPDTKTVSESGTPLKKEEQTTEQTSEQTTISSASRFAEWWSAYPKKTGRKNCLAKWKARKLDSIADTLIADVKNRLANHRPWKQGYIPNPLTYLNGDRWEDEIELVTGSGQSQQARSVNRQEALEERNRQAAEDFAAGAPNAR